ncbi:MAG: serpin family protein [Planctomycetota bacterium]|jgi:serpin B
MKTVKSTFIILALVVVLICGSSAGNPAEKPDDDTNAVVQGNNDFALELYAQLRDQQGNLFLAPYSISTALAMTYAGARGRTEAQMARVLHFPMTVTPGAEPSSASVHNRQQFHTTFGSIVKGLNARGDEGAYELTVANALWGQQGYGFLAEFLDLIEASYDGNLNEVDFVNSPNAACRKINAWVEERTNGKIKDLIPEGMLSPLIRLVVTNAIYFKGNWASQFKEENTKDAPFTLADGKKINAPLMNQTAEFGYMQTADFQALELPYVDQELSMIIFLPKKFDALPQFEKTLTTENLSRWMHKLRKQKVIVSVPKFKMTKQFGLVKVLAGMGMTDAFSGTADFSGINGKKDLFISAIIHKAYVDVNEEGTEAAAATAVLVGRTSVAPPPPVFRADHPFLFLIRDNQSGGILFIGRLMNPKA